MSDARILDATVACIRRHGVQGSTTRAIAEAAGVNEVTLFRRFGDKSTLVRAAVHHSIAQLGAGAFVATEDVRADLTAIVAYYAASFDPTSGIAIVLLAEASRHPPLADLLTEPVAVAGRACAVIQHHQDRGTLVAEPVGDALAALTGPLLSSSLARAIRGITLPDDGFPDRLVDGFLRGHAARG